MSLKFKSREVPINAIRVPWDTLPGADKIAKCYGFYRQHGFLDRVIVIDKQNWIRDGLAGLMVARAVGLKRVKVLQVTEKNEHKEIKPAPTFTPCSCYVNNAGRAECWGTRERDECRCGGYKELCTFYPEYRKTAAVAGGSHDPEV